MSTPVIETDKANLQLMSGKSMLHILKELLQQYYSLNAYDDVKPTQQDSGGDVETDNEDQGQANISVDQLAAAGVLVFVLSVPMA